MAAPGMQPERPPGPSMLAFWDDLLGPLVDALLPERILEIGSDQGATTRTLLEYAQSHGATLHAIDPKPNFDVEELKQRYPDALVFHLALSLEVLPRLERVDLALIDGDHNWHTVLSELRLLESRAVEDGGQVPVIALHDVGWPYGRRDLYYDPDNIPADKRRPFERRAIHPDSDELVDEGINAHLANAKTPAPSHSGVHGAIDDFLAESELSWKLFEVPGQHGLGVLATEEVLEERGRMKDLLEATGSAEFLRARSEVIERGRIDAEVRRAKANRVAALARAELDEERKVAEATRGRQAESLRQLEEERDLHAAELAAAREQGVGAARDLGVLRDELEDAERRIRRLTQQCDAGDEREATLEDELAAERRKARLAGEEAEAAQERRQREAARLAELEAELKTAKAEVEARGKALASAEAGAAALKLEIEESARSRQRLVADFEESRDGLERVVDDLRSQADTGRHAAAEMREMLEERELELQRLNNQLLTLQATLGRSRAEAEVAQAERSALERRLGELAALHQSALDDLGAAVPPSVAPPAEPEPAPEPDPAPGPPLAAETEVVEIAYSEVEIEALESFTTEYDPLSPHGADPLALPSPRDRHGVLRSAGAAATEGLSVDVVVCVHNALDDVRKCLWSLVHKGSHPFRLIVVNDGSDEETTAYLTEVAAINPEMTLIENLSPPHGYTIAANLGMREASGDYVVVLNSDTIVTFGWLERIIACGESDERIGILGPLSNAASHQSVPELRDGDAWATNPLPAFTTEDGISKLLERISPRSRPRLPFINGFCYVVKRAVFEAIGYFDEENFASGYCEENDFSYRAALAGFELAVVDDCYVFHAKSKSFTPEVRKPIAKRNYEIFLDKHDRETIQALVRGMEADVSLKPLRYAVADALSSPGALAGALDAARHDPLNVAFILPGLGAGGSGGSHSIYQEVRGLRQLGVPAKILLPERVWERAAAAYDDVHEVFETFSDLDELAVRTADADVISATHFKSVEMLADLRARRQDFLPAYYVQDYEPFFTARDSDDAREAIASYTAVPDCLLFAKTHWLCNIVGDRHGLHVAKVEPSIDEQLFLPSDLPRTSGPVRVVAMVRPRTPRRQPTATIAVLEALQRRFGNEVELATFGCSGDDMVKLTTSVRLLENHQGLLTRQEVARLLNRSDVFLDMSMYQAFGRTALEAMACGCTAVVPRLGGAWEFVLDGVNSHAVDTLDPNTAIEFLSGLVGDRDRVREMQTAGLQTAQRYSINRAALSEYLIFTHEHARRFGRERAAA